jgi:diadenosine tetraphosphate (Ap4A) HIT family hydrolase
MTFPCCCCCCALHCLLQVDTNLVASVGDEVYLALDKGPITPQHCLVIPIEHYPSWAALPEAAAAEAGRYLSALRTAAAASGQQLVGFERHLKLR